MLENFLFRTYRAEGVEFIEEEHAWPGIVRRRENVANVSLALAHIPGQ